MAKQNSNTTKNIVRVLVVLAIIAAIVFLSRLNADTSTPSMQNGEETTAAAAPEGMRSPADLARIGAKAAKYDRAPEIANPTGFVNVPEGFNLSDHIGKEVIIVDFWTYSCINCQRTLPYLTAWDAKYRDDGLLIIGIHTPEFEFEKDIENVRKAAQKFGVNYPVVLDSDHGTWNAYSNRYWPHKYFIDIDGFVVGDHIGEGGYEESERTIQELLAERREVLGLNMTIDENITAPVEAPEFGKIRTPELYLGYAFARGHLGNEEGWQPDKIVTYTLPTEITTSKFYLGGTWKNNDDNMEAVENATIVLYYTAKDAYMVAGADEVSDVEAIIDGQSIGSFSVKDQTLYTAVDGASYGSHLLELRVPEGVRVHTFTFG